MTALELMQYHEVVIRDQYDLSLLEINEKSAIHSSLHLQFTILFHNNNA